MRVVTGVFEYSKNLMSLAEGQSWGSGMVAVLVFELVGIAGKVVGFGHGLVSNKKSHHSGMGPVNSLPYS